MRAPSHLQYEYPQQEIKLVNRYLRSIQMEISVENLMIHWIQATAEIHLVSRSWLLTD